MHADRLGESETLDWPVDWLEDTWDGESDADLAERWDYEHGVKDEPSPFDFDYGTPEDNWHSGYVFEDEHLGHLQDVQEEADLDAYRERMYDPDYNGF